MDSKTLYYFFSSFTRKKPSLKTHLMQKKFMQKLKREIHIQEIDEGQLE